VSDEKSEARRRFLDEPSLAHILALESLPEPLFSSL